MAKMLDHGPVMVLVFEAQQLTVKRKDGVDEVSWVQCHAQQQLNLYLYYFFTFAGGA